MALIIQLMNRQCTTCNEVVHCFFKSQEEYDKFQCKNCVDFSEYLAKIDSYGIYE